MVDGSIPNFRVMYGGISTGTSLLGSKAGAGGASVSFHSGSWNSCAWARPAAPSTQASRIVRLARNMGRVVRRGRVVGKMGIRIGVEAGAGRQLESRFMARAGRVALEFAGSHIAAQEAVSEVLPRQVAGELGQRHFIDASLEFDHHVEWHPVVVPAPGVELRVVGGAQVQIPVVTGQLQQIPDLLLALVVAACVTADEPIRHLVAQPVTGTGDDSHMLRVETDFLMQFPEHGLLGTFAAIDAALRKLPGMGAYAFAPENLVSLVEQDDADVGPEAVPVEHNQTPIF